MTHYPKNERVTVGAAEAVRGQLRARFGPPNFTEYLNGGGSAEVWGTREIYARIAIDEYWSDLLACWLPQVSIEVRDRLDGFKDAAPVDGRVELKLR